MTVLEGNKLLLSLKVLYIEDEDFARNELSVFLRRRVGKLLTASNGEEGLAVFDEEKPDLVLTDLKMPIMDGLQFIEELRKTGSNCPVIVISALSDSDTIIKTVNLGIVKYVIKPLDTNELIKNMENLALNILGRLMDTTLIASSSVINKEIKVELEKKIRGELAYFLKNFTGKGPRDIQVFIRGNKIEAKAFGVLTIFENSLLTSRRNYGLVDYNRKLFYEENAVLLEKKLSDAVGCAVKFLEVKPDAENNNDEIILSIF